MYRIRVPNYATLLRIQLRKLLKHPLMVVHIDCWYRVNSEKSQFSKNPVNPCYSWVSNFWLLNTFPQCGRKCKIVGICGKSWLILNLQLIVGLMLNLLGEHNCKIDAKGRLMFPARLRRQLETVIHHGLVINRDIFENCLVLYPKPEWDKVNAEMTQLSRYNRKHQLFQRKFMKGATIVNLDSSGRLNILKELVI